MVVERLREQFPRVRELSAQLNEHSDEATRVVALTETFLSETSGVGVEADITLESNAVSEPPTWERLLRYGRFHDGKFRVFIADRDYEERDPYNDGPSETWTAWSNCAREVRLKAYDRLPELVERVIHALTLQTERLKESTASVESLLGFVEKPKGGKK